MWDGNELSSRVSTLNFSSLSAGIFKAKKAKRTNKHKRSRAGSDRCQTKEKKYKNAKDTQTKNLLIVEYRESRTGGQRQRSDNNGANEMIARFRLVLDHFDC